MSRLLCCRRRDMGAALSAHPQEGETGDGGQAEPPTMADVIRERKKKAGGAGLGTLRRRLAAAARRPRDSRPDRGCEHARFIRSVVGSWRLCEVFALCEELEAGAALRDLATQAELAREPAPALHAALHSAAQDRRWCDVQLAGAGWALPAPRALLAARCPYFRDLLRRQPPGSCRVMLDGPCAALSRADAAALLCALYCGPCAPRARTRHERHCEQGSSDGSLDIINVESSGSCSCSLGAARGVRRLAERLGARLDDLATDMRYLLDSGARWRGARPAACAWTRRCCRAASRARCFTPHTPTRLISRSSLETRTRPTTPRPAVAVGRAWAAAGRARRPPPCWTTPASSTRSPGSWRCRSWRRAARTRCRRRCAPTACRTSCAGAPRPSPAPGCTGRRCATCATSSRR